MGQIINANSKGVLINAGQVVTLSGTLDASGNPQVIWDGSTAYPSYYSATQKLPALNTGYAVVLSAGLLLDPAATISGYRSAAMFISGVEVETNTGGFYTGVLSSTLLLISATASAVTAGTITAAAGVSNHYGAANWSSFPIIARPMRIYATFNGLEATPTEDIAAYSVQMLYVRNNDTSQEIV